MNHSGHIIVLRPDLDVRKYESADYVKKNLHLLKRLREILSFLNPTNYCGTGREHFDGSPYWINENGKLEIWPDTNISQYDNLEARKLFAKYEDANTPKDTLDDFCFFSLAEMQTVFDLLDDKANYEIIEIIENEEQTTEKTIGFDIGYLGGDFYSAIADTAIKPTWHPPDFDDMQDIIEHLKKLNEHCLCPTLQQAQDFRDLYLTKAWGEKESYAGQITCIQIRKVI